MAIKIGIFLGVLCIALLVLLAIAGFSAATEILIAGIILFLLIVGGSAFSGYGSRPAPKFNVPSSEYSSEVDDES